MPLAIEHGTSDDIERRVHNSSLVFDPSGHCVRRYDKMHLFRFDNGQERFDESRVQLRGGAPVSFDLPSRDGHRWKIGMSVCYDLRFPEMYRQYSAAGTDVLLVPSAFTYATGEAHWELLLRARAVENLAYVVAPAQGGCTRTVAVPGATACRSIPGALCCANATRAMASMWSTSGTGGCNRSDCNCRRWSIAYCDHARTRCACASTLAVVLACRVARSMPRRVRRAHRQLRVRRFWWRQFTVATPGKHGPPHDQHQRQQCAQGFKQNQNHESTPVARGEWMGLSGHCRNAGGLRQRTGVT